MDDEDNLDALIVRNISDLEAAMTRAHELDETLKSAVGDAVEEACCGAWVGSPWKDEEHARFWHGDWQSGEADGGGPAMWLEIDERAGPGGLAKTWIATFSGDNIEGASAALWLQATMITNVRSYRSILVRHAELKNDLLASGFDFDEKDPRRFCIPIRIDAAVLAAAFAEEDWSEAMKPVKAAVETAMRCEAPLRRLLDHLSASG